MDIPALAQGVTTALVSFLPYALQKVGDGGLTEIGKKALNASWDTTKGLWNKLWSKVETDQYALKATQDLAADPTDSDSQAALRKELKRLFKDDQSFASEIEQLLNQALASGTITVSADRGGIATSGNVIDSTLITGGVKGDFTGGNKGNS